MATKTTLSAGCGEKHGGAADGRTNDYHRFMHVSDTGVDLQSTNRNASKPLTRAYRNKGERRLMAVIGALVATGLLLAAVIWWQLLS